MRWVGQMATAEVQRGKMYSLGRDLEGAWLAKDHVVRTRSRAGDSELFLVLCGTAPEAGGGDACQRRRGRCARGGLTLQACAPYFFAITGRAGQARGSSEALKPRSWH